MNKILMILILTGLMNASYGSTLVLFTSSKMCLPPFFAKYQDTLVKEKNTPKRFILATGSHVGVGARGSDMKNARSLSNKENSWDLSENGNKRYIIHGGGYLGSGVKDPAIFNRDSMLPKKQVNDFSSDKGDNSKRILIQTGSHVGVGAAGHQ